MIGFPVIAEPCGLVGQVAGILQVDVHVRQIVLQDLETADRSAEGVSLLDVLKAEIIDGGDDADTHHGHADAFRIEHSHDLIEGIAAHA